MKLKPGFLEMKDNSGRIEKRYPAVIGLPAGPQAVLFGRPWVRAINRVISDEELRSPEVDQVLLEAQRRLDESVPYRDDCYREGKKFAYARRIIPTRPKSRLYLEANEHHSFFVFE